jgi:hypothetical protein
MREAVDIEELAEPCLLAERRDVAVESPRTNAPITIAFSGSLRNNLVPCGNSMLGPGRRRHFAS